VARTATNKARPSQFLFKKRLQQNRCSTLMQLNNLEKYLGRCCHLSRSRLATGYKFPRFAIGLVGLDKATRPKLMLFVLLGL
jgi:hypothetical protein